MDGTIPPAAIAITVSLATALMGGFVSLWGALRARQGTGVARDSAAAILFGIAIVLTVLILVAAALIGAGGMAYVVALKVALMLTAAFACVGVIVGLRRGLRSGSASKPQGA